MDPRKSIFVNQREAKTAKDTDNKTSHSPLAATKEAIAADLAQIYVLGDKYQLPALKRRTLEKAGKLVANAEGPVPFLHLVTILNDYIPDLDACYREFVRMGLQKAVDKSKGGSSAMAQAIITAGGYMRRGTEPLENILHAVANMTEIAKMPFVSSDGVVDDS